MIRIALSVTVWLLLACPDFAAADPLITQKQSNYMPDIPPTSFATVTSKLIKIERSKQGISRIFIPAKSAIALTVTHNKNPILAESVPAEYVRELFVVDSRNDLSRYPIDAQVIVHNHAQSVRVVAINLAPTGIELLARSYTPNRPLQAEEGAGVAVINSSCIKNRVVCTLGCTYVMVPDIACRQKLGIR